jgi:hypothetical protein
MSRNSFTPVTCQPSRLGNTGRALFAPALLVAAGWLNEAAHADQLPQLAPARAGKLVNCSTLVDFKYANTTITSATIAAAGTERPQPTASR